MMWATQIAATALPPTIISAGAEEGPDDHSMAMAAQMDADLSGYDRARQEAAQQMPETAITAFVLDREWDIEQIQDSGNPHHRDGNLYAFVLDESGIFAAHGAVSDLAGADIYDITDIQGTPLGDLFAESRSPYDRRVEYWWPNPATESPESEPNLAWLRTSSEYLFGVGIYP